MEIDAKVGRITFSAILTVNVGVDRRVDVSSLGGK